MLQQIDNINKIIYTINSHFNSMDSNHIETMKVVCHEMKQLQLQGLFNKFEMESRIKDDKVLVSCSVQFEGYAYPHIIKKSYSISVN